MKLFLIFLFTVTTYFATAQFLTQSADGKGSIPLPLKGAGATVDIGKTEIVFGLNNYGRVFDSLKNEWFGGINISGKNSEGIANLFNSGDIVPEGELSLFGGYSLSNNAALLKKYLADPLFTLVRAARDSMNDLQKNKYPDSIKLSISNFGILIKDGDERNFVVQQLCEKIDSTRSDLIQSFLETYGADYQGLKIFVDSLRTSGQKIRTYFGRMISEIDTRNQIRVADLQKKFAWHNTTWRLTFFMQGGIEARSFKRFIGTTLPDFNKSFQDTLFRGGNFGIGTNFQINDWTFGFAYGYHKTDNFMALTSKDYTIRKTDTSGSQSLIQEKKVTAYSGKYSKVEVNELNIDVVLSLKLNKEDSSRLLVNPYLRASLFSRDTAYLKNYTNIGLAVYLLGNKRKFIGGLYVELPDISNNIEKAKPESEQDLRPPFKRLSFGIVTKISLSSIFGFVDKPRKPD